MTGQPPEPLDEEAEQAAQAEEADAQDKDDPHLHGEQDPGSNLSSEDDEGH